MFEKSHFLQLRGTVFVNQPIAYTTDNLTPLMSTFNQFVPSLITGDLPKGILPITIEQQPWKLVSSDNSIEINFTSNKIDVLKTIGTIYNETILEDFVTSTSDAITKISKLFNLEVNRMAVSPSYALKTYDLGSIQSFSKKIFFKNSFGEEPIDCCNFNAVFRLKKAIGGMENIKVNFLAKFEESNILEQKSGLQDNIVPCLCFTFDINTYPIPGLKFREQEIADFFANSVEWNKDFADYYFEK